MVFREPGDRERPHGRVAQGPFPLRWGLIGVVLATAFIGAVMLLVGLQTERLTCDARSCTDGHTTFERSELHGAHHVVENGSKNTKYGVVVVELANGERRMMSVEPAEAEAVANAIRSACDRGTPIDVELHEPRWMIVAAFVLFLASAIFVGIVLRHMGVVDCLRRLDRRGGRRSAFRTDTSCRT